MTNPDASDLTATAQRLEESMDSLGRQVDGLNTYGHRNRRMILALTVSITLDLILSAFLAVVALQAHDATSLASQNAQTQQATCLASNQARALNLQLWTYVLDLSAHSAQTPDQKTQAEQFRTYINHTFVPADCARLP